MRRIHRLIDSIGQKPFWVFVLIAFFLISGITIRKTLPFQGNLSALIGVWEGFSLINPGYFPESFVVHSDGGYDGQFFYLIARYLFDPSFSFPPILDSFELRFSRIGLSFLAGFFSFFLGFDNYPYITFLLLWMAHFFASFLLYKKLQNTKYNYLYLFFLFSPFAWNSNFLMVSDSLFASCFVFIVFSFEAIGLVFFSEKGESYRIHKKEYYLPVFLLCIFFLSIRETSLPIIGSFLLFAVWRLHFPAIWILSLALLVYGVGKFLLKYQMFYLQGTNPLGFLELIEAPLWGFVKSFGTIQNWDMKTLAREVGKIVIFGLLVAQSFSIKNAFSEANKFKYLPLLFFSLLMLVAEEGYWLTFDNVSRFLTISVPYIILLKSQNKNFRSYVFFHLVIVLFLLFLGRMVFLGKTI